jgi:hypothetical protein
MDSEMGLLILLSEGRRHYVQLGQKVALHKVSSKNLPYCKQSTYNSQISDDTISIIKRV